MAAISDLMHLYVTHFLIPRVATSSRRHENELGDIACRTTTKWRMFKRVKIVHSLWFACEGFFCLNDVVNEVDLVGLKVPIIIRAPFWLIFLITNDTFQGSAKFLCCSPTKTSHALSHMKIIFHMWIFSIPYVKWKFFICECSISYVKYMSHSLRLHMWNFNEFISYVNWVFHVKTPPFHMRSKNFICENILIPSVPHMWNDMWNVRLGHRVNNQPEVELAWKFFPNFLCAWAGRHAPGKLPTQFQPFPRLFPVRCKHGKI